ncbi:MAG: hypothetical protein KDI45_04630 [Candidatus Accumulibacter sp.]|nr:hypothetical protein [Accumulibacter sp.]
MAAAAFLIPIKKKALCGELPYSAPSAPQHDSQEYDALKDIQGDLAMPFARRPITVAAALALPQLWQHAVAQESAAMPA